MGKHEKEALERLRDFVITRRKSRDWRQQDVADRAGLSQSWVASLESARLKNTPQNETLIKLAKGIALPDESSGSLYNFLELVLAGSFEPDVVGEVARGELDPRDAMHQATHGVGVSFTPPDEPDAAASIFFDRELRSEGRDLVLKVLRRDLGADDFQVARRLIDLLYQETEREVEASRSP